MQGRNATTWVQGSKTVSDCVEQENGARISQASGAGAANGIQAFTADLTSSASVGV